MSKRCGCFSEKIKSSLTQTQLASLSNDLLIIAVKSRLELLFLLEIKPHCVCDLMSHTKMSQSLISHHLSDLEVKKYILSKRSGKFIEYSLTEKGSTTIKALKLLVN